MKFYNSVAKGLKLKFRKFWKLITLFVEVTGEKLVEGELFVLPRLEAQIDKVEVKLPCFGVLCARSKQLETIIL